MKKKRIGILTGGGDVQPLNSIFAGLKLYPWRSNITILSLWDRVFNCPIRDEMLVEK